MTPSATKTALVFKALANVGAVTQLALFCIRTVRFRGRVAAGHPIPATDCCLKSVADTIVQRMGSTCGKSQPAEFGDRVIDEGHRDERNE